MVIKRKCSLDYLKFNSTSMKQNEILKLIIKSGKIEENAKKFTFLGKIYFSAELNLNKFKMHTTP